MGRQSRSHLALDRGAEGVVVVRMGRSGYVGVGGGGVDGGWWWRDGDGGGGEGGAG